MSTKKFIQGLILIVLLGAGLLSALDAFSQSIPISERVVVPYYVKVSTRGTEVTLVLDKRINDGRQIQSVREAMTRIANDTCAEKCTERQLKIIKRKVLQEAKDQGVSATDVTFK